MILLRQRMYDNYAEALDGSVVCVMTRDCVGKYLLRRSHRDPHHRDPGQALG